jgi:Zn-dependent protease with chaperone function
MRIFRGFWRAREYAADRYTADLGQAALLTVALACVIYYLLLTQEGEPSASGTTAGTITSRGENVAKPNAHVQLVNSTAPTGIAEAPAPENRSMLGKS